MSCHSQNALNQCFKQEFVHGILIPWAVLSLVLQTVLPLVLQSILMSMFSVFF